MTAVDVNAALRGHEFLPHHIAVTIPAIYATEDVPMLDKVVHAHYFIGSSDWWVFEYDPEEQRGGAPRRHRFSCETAKAVEVELWLR